MTWLEISAACATIITAVIVVIAYVHFGSVQLRNRWRVERYLKSEKEAGRDQGQRSLTHLVARIGLTETEIMDASFRSKCIRRRIVSDPATKRAVEVLLEYEGETSN